MLSGSFRRVRRGVASGSDRGCGHCAVKAARAQEPVSRRHPGVHALRRGLRCGEQGNGLQAHGARTGAQPDGGARRQGLGRYVLA